MKAKFPIIQNSTKWIIIALIIMVVSAILFFVNFRPSIQFTGGIQIKTNTDLNIDSIDTIRTIPGVDQVGLNTETINGTPHTTVLAQVTTKDDLEMTDLSNEIQESLITNGYIQSKDNIVESSIVGPSIGEYLRNSAITTMLVGLALMVIYMMFAFSQTRTHIAPQILAVITLFTICFDVLVPMGVYGIKMMIDPTAQVDLIFVIAILTTIGYSINDTVVVYDRIRENLDRAGTKIADIGKVFEDSIWQTMTRSIMTSASTFVVVTAMFIIGTGDLSRFAFTMGIGVISAGMSSIFLAAPLAYLMIKHKNKK